MKIALVILHADPSRGGAERYTFDLAGALARQGHEVSLLASSFADQSNPAVKQVELSASAATRTRRYLRFLQSLDRHLQSCEYDVVHAMLPVRQCDLYHPHAGIAAEQTRKWNALFNPRRRAMAEVERQAVARADGPMVLALSKYVASAVTQAYPQLPAHRLATLLNGVDLAHYQAPAVRPAHPDGSTVALMVANDFERKGLAPAIAAAGRLAGNGLKLVVVGRDRSGAYAAQAKRVGANVEFAGPATNVLAHYSSADVFVLPTRHDPCSLVVIEALAMGLPVISTRFNGACEYMTDGVHGFVLDDPNNVDALTLAMRQLLDPTRRKQMSDACIALRPALSYDAHLNQLLAIYDQAVKHRRNGGR